jgi:hypothetical protein
LRDLSGKARAKPLDTPGEAGGVRTSAWKEILSIAMLIELFLAFGP